MIKYFFEIEKDNKFSSGVILAASDLEAVQRFHTDMKTSKILLEKCLASKTIKLIDTFTEE